MASLQLQFYRYDYMQLDFGEESGVLLKRTVGGQIQDARNSTYRRTHKLIISNKSSRSVNVRIKEKLDSVSFDRFVTLEPSSLSPVVPPVRLDPEAKLERDRAEFVVSVAAGEETEYTLVAEYKSS